MSPAHLAIFWAAVASYMATVCAIGLWHYRRASKEEGFLVAGRSLGPILGGATLMANQVSAGATIGIVGFHYYSGFSYAWTWPLVWIGWVVCARVRRAEDPAARRLHAARLLRRALRQPGRARDLGGVHPDRVLGDALGAVPGRRAAVHARQRHPVRARRLLVAAITTVYTVLGGMYSNAYVGLLKAVLLLGGYFLAVPFLLKATGGLHAIGVALTRSIRGSRRTGSAGGSSSRSRSRSASAWRPRRTRSRRSTRCRAGAPRGWPSAGRSSSRRSSASACSSSGSRCACWCRICPSRISATPMLGTSVLPFGVGLLVLLAAIVTFTRTGGAILLTVASAVSHDLYGKLLKPDATDRAKVVAGRLAVVLFSAIPVALAFRELALVNFIVIYAAKLMVSFLFVPVVIGLNWRRATRAGRPGVDARRPRDLRRLDARRPPLPHRARLGGGRHARQRGAVLRREPGDQAGRRRARCGCFFPRNAGSRAGSRGVILISAPTIEEARATARRSCVHPSRQTGHSGQTRHRRRRRPSAPRVRLRRDVGVRSVPAARRLPQRQPRRLPRRLPVASAPRHRDDHLRARRHRGARRQPRQPRPARRGRRAVDDGGQRHPPPGNAAGRSRRGACTASSSGRTSPRRSR